MQSAAEQFRQANQARTNGKRSPGRYPNDLRDLALRHLAWVRRNGGRANQAARDLGVDANTLRLWEKRDRPVGQPAVGTLLPVELAATPARSVVPYVVHGPHGLRVECSSVGDVAALFRALA